MFLEAYPHTFCIINLNVLPWQNLFKREMDLIKYLELSKGINPKYLRTFIIV